MRPEGTLEWILFGCVALCIVATLILVIGVITGDFKLHCDGQFVLVGKVLVCVK